MPRITASAPVLLVRDVVAAANYYRDCLGFHYEQFYGEPPNFCILHRDGHYLMLAQAENHSQLKPYREVIENMCNAYYWVDAVDALFEEFKARGAKIGFHPCTQPYGVRELGIQDLDGHDITFGQILR